MGQLPEGVAGMEEPETIRQLPPMQRPRAGGRGYLGLPGRDHRTTVTSHTTKRPSLLCHSLVFA